MCRLGAPRTAAYRQVLLERATSRASFVGISVSMSGCAITTRSPSSWPHPTGSRRESRVPQAFKITLKRVIDSND